MTDAASVTVEQVGDASLVRLSAKRFDAESFDVLTRKLYHMIDREGCRKVVLNLQDVHYLFSESVGLLVGLEKRIKRSGCQLRLCGLRPTVRQTLEISQLHDLFEIHEDEAAALKGF
ncbi:MAG TPA: STAS domain-containing protein [Planctomycetaceae bacterium]|nr:STAS domain-containing protein [Planctomycetaceae bacterium]